MNSYTSRQNRPGNPMHGYGQWGFRLQGYAVLSLIFFTVSTGWALAGDYTLWRTDRTKAGQAITAPSKADVASVVEAIQKPHADLGAIIEQRKLYSEPLLFVAGFSEALRTAEATRFYEILDQIKAGKILDGSKAVDEQRAFTIREVLKEIFNNAEQEEPLDSKALAEEIFSKKAPRALYLEAFQATDKEPVAKESELSDDLAKRLKELESKLEDQLVVVQPKPPASTPTPTPAPTPELDTQAIQDGLAPVCDAIEKLTKGMGSLQLGLEDTASRQIALLNLLSKLNNTPPVADDDDDSADRDRNTLADALRKVRQEQPASPQFASAPQSQMPQGMSAPSDSFRNQLPTPTEASPRNDDMFNQPQVIPASVPATGFYGPTPKITTDVGTVNRGTKESRQAADALNRAVLLNLDEIPQVINPLTGAPNGNVLTTAGILGGMKTDVNNAMVTLIGAKTSLQKRIDAMDLAVQKLKADALGPEPEERLQALQAEAQRAKREVENNEQRAQQGDLMAQGQLLALRSKASEAEQLAFNYQNSEMARAKKEVRAAVQGLESQKAKLESQVTEVDTQVAMLKKRSSEISQAIGQNEQAAVSSLMLNSSAQSGTVPNIFGAGAGRQAVQTPSVRSTVPQNVGPTGGVRGSLR